MSRDSGNEPSGKKDLGNIQRLAETLRENLQKCADDPDVDAVHDTRTGTRRLQATLEDIVRELPAGSDSDGVRKAATALMRQLKKIRHEAGRTWTCTASCWRG